MKVLSDVQPAAFRTVPKFQPAAFRAVPKFQPAAFRTVPKLASTVPAAGQRAERVEREL